MRDDEAEVLPLPRPAGERGAKKIQRQRQQPDIEPGRVVDVVARDGRIELRLHHRGERDRARDGDEQKHREIQRAEQVDRHPERRGLAPLPDLGAALRLRRRVSGWRSWRARASDAESASSRDSANQAKMPLKSRYKRALRPGARAYYRRRRPNDPFDTLRRGPDIGCPLRMHAPSPDHFLPPDVASRVITGRCIASPAFARARFSF